MSGPYWDCRRLPELPTTAQRLQAEEPRSCRGSPSPGMTPNSSVRVAFRLLGAFSPCSFCQGEKSLQVTTQAAFLWDRDGWKCLLKEHSCIYPQTLPSAVQGCGLAAKVWKKSSGKPLNFLNSLSPLSHQIPTLPQSLSSHDRSSISPKAGLSRINVPQVFYKPKPTLGQVSTVRVCVRFLLTLLQMMAKSQGSWWKTEVADIPATNFGICQEWKREMGSELWRNQLLVQ